MTSTNVQTAATLLSKAFETRTRDNGDKFVCLKDGSPEWMTDVIHAAHGDSMPNDTVYRFCERVADALADADADADPAEVIYEIEPDIYTSDLTAWLNASNSHIEYLTRAIEEDAPTDGFKLLAIAQKMHIEEVGFALVAALEKADIETEE